FGHAPRGLQLRRFRPPLLARIEFREQRPALIRSAVCNGAIADRRGPFFCSGNWWDNGRWWRQEWDVQTADGAMYRIFLTHCRRRIDHGGSNGPSGTGRIAARIPEPLPIADAGAFAN